MGSIVSEWLKWRVLNVYERFNIKGRGIVFLVENDHYAIGEYVRDKEGECYMITGVEVSRKGFHVDSKVGLVLRPIGKEDKVNEN